MRGGNDIIFYGTSVIDTPPHINYPQSSSPFPNHTQRNCLSGEERGTLPPEYNNLNSNCQTHQMLESSVKPTNNPIEVEPRSQAILN